MGLARVWRRQLFGASGLAVLVPAALIGALGLLALAGGFARLGGLGQVLNGPAVPSSAEVGNGLGGTGASAGSGGAGGGPGASGETLLAATTTNGGAGSGPETGRGPGTEHTGGGPGSHGFTGGPQPVPSGTGVDQPLPPSPPPHRPAPHPTLIDGAVSAGTSVTSKLPAPVGPVATHVLQSAGQTVDKILPPPPSSRPLIGAPELLGGVHVR